MKRPNPGNKSDGTSKSREGASSKRTKSSQACAACRRHKTRCELLEPGATLGAALKCHRCKVLNVECSFETSDSIHIIQNPQPPLPEPETAAEKLCANGCQSRNKDSNNSGISPPPVILACGRMYTVQVPARALHSSVLRDPKFETTRVHAEDLVPSPASLWGIMDMPAGFDWTAKPILALQELTKVASPQQPTAPVHLGPYDHLGTILSSEQVSFLLNIFEVKYEPWIYIETRPSTSDTPLLNLVRCLVASRHLEPDARARVTPQLQKLTEDACLQQVFNPSPSLECVEAHLILSLWSPVGGTLEQESRDPRLLISSAVTTAINLEVLQAPQKVTSLREKEKAQNGLLPAEEKELSKAILKSGWSLRLATVESMLCLGTGRQPLSRHSDENFEALNIDANCTLDSSRQTRLAMAAKLFEWTERGLKMRLEELDLVRFQAEAGEVMIQMECIKRFITPQTVIAPYDNAHFHILLVQHFGCKLIVQHHLLQELRRVFEPIQKPWFRLEADGNASVICLVRETIGSAEGVLTNFLAWHDHSALATVPDSVFYLISFAAAWLVISNFTMYKAHASQLGGSCNRLILATIPRLSAIALSPDHAPAKCSRVISALYASWEKLVGVSIPATSTDGNGAQPTAGGHPTSAFPMPDALFTHSGQPSFDTHNPADSHFSLPAFDAEQPHFEDVFNSELFAEPDFWATFMASIASGTVESQ